MYTAGKFSETGEREGVVLFSDRVEVGVVPPDRRRDRAWVVAESVAVEEAKAAELEGWFGVEGLFGKLSGGPSEDALSVRSMNGF